MSSEKNIPPPPPGSISLTNIVNPQSKPSFSTSAEIRLDQSMSLFLKGKREYDKGEIDNAINLFKSSIENLKNLELGSDSSTFYSYLGLSYQKKGWESYAKAQFQQALNINPNDSIAQEYFNKTEKPKKQDIPENKQNQDNGLIKKFKSIFVRKIQ
jgi:tetratricopeptide (TPR) repeat protein